MSGQTFRFAVRVKPGARREKVGGRWPGPTAAPGSSKQPGSTGGPDPNAASGSVEGTIAPKADGSQGREARSGSALMVAVTAAAVEGKANEAVRRALAKAFGVRRQDVRLVSGERSREKLIELDPAPADASSRLAGLLEGS
jgi:uncharacterized protein